MKESSIILINWVAKGEYGISFKVQKFANSSLNETMKSDNCMYGIFGRNIQHSFLNVRFLFIGYDKL